MTAGLAECGWVALLSFVLPGLAEAERWSAAWAVLDTAEALGLFGTGWLLMRRHRRCALAAGAAAALLLIDAGVDVTTSAAGTPRSLALLEACVAEVPLAVACGLLALYIVRQQPFSRDGHRGGPNRLQHMAATRGLDLTERHGPGLAHIARLERRSR